MNRNEIIDFLKDLADGLGPFTHLDSVEDYVEFYTNLYKTIDMNSINVLIDIMLNPPSKDELGRISLEDFEFELIQVLISVGRNDVTNFFKRTESLMHIKHTRPIIISVFGELCNEGSCMYLEPLLQEDLNEDEIIRLADGLCESGGNKANELLEKLKIKYSDSSEVAVNEIDTCLAILEYRNTIK